MRGRQARHVERGMGGGGFFFGLERRELLRTYWLGLTFGYELGVGG